MTAVDQAVRMRMQAMPLLQRFYDQLMSALRQRSDLGVLVSGSLASGRMDRFSDLDIEVVVYSALDVRGVQAWVHDTVRGLGDVIASFPADHLGLDDLQVIFFEAEGSVVKLDIWVMELDGLARLPNALVVHDPGGALQQARAAMSPSSIPLPDFSDLHNKFCGWIWFTYVKISRGGFFEAAESLEIMRSYALMPFLQAVDGVPPEGYRLLEERLSPRRKSQLVSTYPQVWSQVGMIEALFALCELFSELQASRTQTGSPDHQTAKLSRMVELVQEDWEGVNG